MDTKRSILPGTESVGTRDTWQLPDGGGSVDVVGRFLGFGSSQKTWHARHEGEYAALRERCAACRWSEFRIFRKTKGRGYVVHTIGGSSVPGEVDGYRPQARHVLTAPEVLEVLTTRLKPVLGAPRGARSVFFSDAAARVLAQSSAFDDDLLDAWENRRVA